MLELSNYFPLLCCCQGKIWREMKIRVGGVLRADKMEKRFVILSQETEG